MTKIVFSEQQLKKIAINEKSDPIEFNEDTIRALFGHEAAEDENLIRLKAYYVKTDIYKSLKSQIPLFILVGHKGIGKSALLNILHAEDKESGNIPIIIQPDDIINLDISNTNFLQKIREWKDGIAGIILEKLILSINDSISEKILSDISWINRFGSLVFSILGKKLSDLQKEHIKLNAATFASLFKDSLFKERQVTVYLDDLDRGWKNSTNDIDSLSAMLNAIRDLSRNTYNLRFRVALRSDVYYAVRTSDETTDKIDSSVIWQRWSNHEILVMLIKRIETYFGRLVNEEFLLKSSQHEIQEYLHSVFEPRFCGHGHWDNAPMYRVLMSLIRKRPRDLIKLCTLSARKAYINHHSCIKTNDLESIFNKYSNDRLTDTSNEYKSELPKIQELLLKMKPSQKELLQGRPCLFTRAQILEKLDNIISMSHFTFKDGKQATAHNLLTFLFKINFLTARKDDTSGIQRIYYDENQYISSEFADFGFSFEIHPSYRWALQPGNINDLFKQIQLTD